MLESFWIVVKMISVYTAPAMFLFVSFSFVFWGYPLKSYIRTVFLFAALLSFIGGIMILTLPMAGQFFYFLSVHFLLFFLLFRKLDLKGKLRISLSSYLLNTLNEALWWSVATHSMTQSELIADIRNLIIVFWPSLVFTGILTFVLYKKPVHLEQFHRFKRQENAQRWLFIILCTFFILQLFLLLIHFLLQYDLDLQMNSRLVQTSFFLVLLVSVVLLIITLKLIELVKDHVVRSTYDLYTRDINRMYSTIRGQRHDFLNHIQVVSSMLSANRYDDAKKYVQDLSQDTEKIKDWIDVGHPGFSALIQAKFALALSRGIRLDFEFSGLSRIPVNVKSIDIVRITGNLLDNAIEAVSALPEEQKWVQIKGIAAEDHLYLSVRNPGPVLGEKVIRKWFEPGYTTKSSGTNSGLGLSIVRDKVEEYGGTLQARSNETEGTVFVVQIPFRK